MKDLIKKIKAWIDALCVKDKLKFSILAFAFAMSLAFLSIASNSPILSIICCGLTGWIGVKLTKFINDKTIE